MQTILGATGVIGKGIAQHLSAYTTDIRLVSRNPKRVNPGDQLFSADLLDAAQVMKAVEGSEVVYLSAGLQYNIKVWRTLWPRIMRNVIDACKAHGARLVFFDNVYLYGAVEGWMTEESPVKPDSKKGQVRAEIAAMLMNAVKAGELQALIARAPDFYGPETPLSFINVMALVPMSKGKSAQLMISDKFRHSFIYTPDAARATALLGNTPAAFNQVWHLPTDANAPTGKAFIEMAAKELGVKPRYTVLPRFVLALLGLFVEAVRESMEMLYQNDRDYRFDSSKFARAFPDFRVTPYAVGIAKTLNSLRESKG